ncbi:MAG TPA: hypothetical protein VEX11_18545 [Acetobacteraceae bacterium]|nr:hypothetical protein [Acetobacteraceae bacterium]
MRDDTTRAALAARLLDWLEHPDGRGPLAEIRAELEHLEGTRDVPALGGAA